MRWLRHNCKFESDFFLSLLSDPLLSLLSVIPLFSPFLSLLISFLPMLPLFLRFPPSPLFHIKLFFIEAHAAWNSIPPGTAGWNTRLFWAPAKQMLVLGVPPEISLHASLFFFFLALPHSLSDFHAFSLLFLDYAPGSYTSLFSLSNSPSILWRATF